MEFRLAVLVDGFNFYHSLRQLLNEEKLAAETKWIDFRALADSFVHQVPISGVKTVVSVDYFSALANHRLDDDPQHVARHKKLIAANEARGVQSHIHRFKKRFRSCKACSEKIKMWEEKETDVAMAIRLLQIFVQKEADVAVLVTGDTDLAPAIRCVFSMFDQAMVSVAFPYGRRNKELAELVSRSGGSFKIRAKAYERARLPNPVILPVGAPIEMPEDWR